MTNPQKLEFIKACKVCDKNELLKFWCEYTGCSLKDFRSSIWQTFFLRNAVQICKECLEDYTFVEYVLESYDASIAGVNLTPTEYWCAKVAILEVSQYNHYQQ